MAKAILSTLVHLFLPPVLLQLWSKTLLWITAVDCELISWFMSLLLQPLLRAGVRAVNMVVGTNKTWPVLLQRKLSLQQ